MIKKIIIFALCLAVWFISFLVPVDYGYYKEIVLPVFAPPTIFYPIAWSICYILIAYSMYKIITSYEWKDIPNSYKIALLVNYLFNQSYTLVFFGLKSTLLGLISAFGTFMTCLFLYEESISLKENSSKVLRFYVILSAFAAILSLTIYLLNSGLY